MDASEIIVCMLTGFWVFLPAMFCNPAAAMIKGNTKIDFGKTWKGKRIFGDGKSWRGFFGGVAAGMILGLLMIGLACLCNDKENCWGFGGFWDNIGILACMCFGSLLGDLTGAFIKRRLGMERGQKAPILDQYDFVAGAFIVTAIFYPNFVYATYFEGWHILAFILILLLTFAIHRGVNIIGYKLGVKKEPW